MSVRVDAVGGGFVGGHAAYRFIGFGAAMDEFVPGAGEPVPGPGMSAGPIVLRMLLGARLRRLREGAGLSPERAGLEIQGSRSKISRLETGRAKFKVRDVEDLLSLYGVGEGPLRSGLLALAGESGKPDWWAEYGHVLPGWFEAYLGLESAASAIRSFEVQFVPGLFQTEGYARAVTRLGRQDAPDGEVEQRVALRLQRQEVLARVDPPRIWSVMDEAVLRRPIGGVAVMRGQLRRLIEVAELPQVSVQVVPFARGGHSGESGSFTVLRFRDADLPDVVYVEQLAGAAYLEQRSDVEHHLEVMDKLSGQALTPAATIGFIGQVASET